MKPVLRQALEDSGREPKAVAADLGVRRSYLYDSVNESEPQRFPVDLLVGFMRATNSLAPLRWLAQQMRCAVLELPDAVAGGAPVVDKALQSIESLGQVVTAMRQAQADGTWTEAEASRVEREINEHLDVIFSLLLDIRALVPREAARMPPPAAVAMVASARHA